jgi:poly(A) polymerase
MGDQVNHTRAMLARSFAEEIVRQLVSAGHTAFFAGGCVRDQLRGEETPDDYDVATSATPEQVTAIFGKHRTILVGVSFGVVCVRGKRDGHAMQVEVATFRVDGKYSDGRHPDSVVYSTAQNDAQRRDFTINGIFFDPIANQVIDYVDGEKDIKLGVVRAIGEPHHRFEEDKLRMLRAIRFAARFNYVIDSTTESAIREMADQIKVVSPERIAMEMRKMFVLARRDWVIRELWSTGLLRTIHPELNEYWSDATKRDQALELVQMIEQSDFCTVAAAVLFDIAHDSVKPVLQYAIDLKQQWRLSNDEATTIGYLLNASETFSRAEQFAWSELQPWLIQPAARQAIDLARCILLRSGKSVACLERCIAALAWPRDQLDPPPLVNGKDLYQAGVKPGPTFAIKLHEIRSLQLDGKLKTHADALEWLSNFR